MPSTLELRWGFTPVTLFEEEFSSTYRGAEINVGAGTVVAQVATEGDDVRPLIRAAIEQYVEGLFYGAQLVEHSAASRTGPSVCVVRADGTRNIAIEVEPGVIRIRAGRVDIRYTNAAGAVVDTKKDRIERKHRLAIDAAILISQDETLARMMRSYRTAILTSKNLQPAQESLTP